MLDGMEQEFTSHHLHHMPHRTSHKGKSLPSSFLMSPCMCYHQHYTTTISTAITTNALLPLPLPLPFLTQWQWKCLPSDWISLWKPISHWKFTQVWLQLPLHQSHSNGHCTWLWEQRWTSLWWICGASRKTNSTCLQYLIFLFSDFLCFVATKLIRI